MAAVKMTSSYATEAKLYNNNNNNNNTGILANCSKYSFYSSGSVSWFRGSIQSSFTRLSQLRTIPTR